jgi:hypothetical protein
VFDQEDVIISIKQEEAVMRRSLESSCEISLVK